MKRLLSICIAIMIAISVNIANAEEFSVRGGVSFTSTKQDIIAYEEGEGNEVVSNPTEKGYFSDNCLMCDNISFAGYDDAEVIYYFDNSDTLISIMFVVTKTAREGGETAVKEIYNRLNDTLNSKYGDSFSLDDALVLEKKEGAYGTTEWLNSFNLGSLMEFEQRIWYIGNGYADIQIMSARHLEMDGAFAKGYTSEDIDQYSVAISYTFIEENIVQNIIDKANQAEAALNSDL